MKAVLAIACGLLLALGAPASAHRLDEYLQTTFLSVEKDRVEAEILLTPGVAVFPAVLATIDTDEDGAVSKAEQRTYAERVLRDLSLTVDGDPLGLRLDSWSFAKTEELKEGRGDIQIQFHAEVPRGGPNRRLTFANHHLSGIAAYLVNSLLPSDPEIRIAAQKRNYRQSFYRLDYVQAGAQPGSRSSRPGVFAWASGARAWLGATALLFAPLALLWRRRTRATNEATTQQ